MSRTILSIKNLAVTFRSDDRAVSALRGIDLDIRRRSVHALVGESGSGKSVAARSILGLLSSKGADVSADSIRFDGRELLSLSESEMRGVRGGEISMIFQEPAKYLNPAYRIDQQIVEMIRVHLGVSRAIAYGRAKELLRLVGLGDENRVIRAYPHELSGGMNQRAMIAMALSCDPKLLIADEPTTALDVSVQRRIVELIGRVNSELGMAVLFISHNLGVVHEASDWVSVIYAGKIVESTSRRALFSSPAHPYTKLLLASIPDPSRRGKPLETISGAVPDAAQIPAGCSFHPRCPFAEAVCAISVPPLRDIGDEHRAACDLIGSKDLSLGKIGATV